MLSAWGKELRSIAKKLKTDFVFAFASKEKDREGGLYQ
jgi:hypothetical protein